MKRLLVIMLLSIAVSSCYEETMYSTATTRTTVVYIFPDTTYWEIDTNVLPCEVHTDYTLVEYKDKMYVADSTYEEGYASMTHWVLLLHQ